MQYPAHFRASPAELGKGHLPVLDRRELEMKIIP